MGGNCCLGHPQGALRSLACVLSLGVSSVIVDDGSVGGSGGGSGELDGGSNGDFGCAGCLYLTSALLVNFVVSMEKVSSLWLKASPMVGNDGGMRPSLTQASRLRNSLSVSSVTYVSCLVLIDSPR